MKLPSFKRLNKQDYQQQDRDLVDRLSVSLNIGIESLYQMSTNQVSLGDNIQCLVKTITVKVDANGKPVSGTSSIAFGTSIPSVTGVTVLRAVNADNTTTYPTGAPFISYTLNGTSININNIAGLPANNNFQLTIVIWG